MEEKERFELFGEHCIKDNNPDARPQLLDAYVACVILNEQDKRIKELEEENKELNDYLETDEVTKREYYQKVDKIDRAKDREIKKLKDKIRELEDYTENTANLIDKLTEDSVFASTQLAISELEKLKEEMVLNGNDYCEIRQGTSPHNPADYAWFNYGMFRKLIDDQINKLKGKVEDEQSRQ